MVDDSKMEQAVPDKTELLDSSTIRITKTVVEDTNIEELKGQLRYWDDLLQTENNRHKLELERISTGEAPFQAKLDAFNSLIADSAGVKI